jgi:hypothetical protein
MCLDSLCLDNREVTESKKAVKAYKVFIKSNDGYYLSMLKPFVWKFGWNSCANPNDKIEVGIVTVTTGLGWQPPYKLLCYKAGFHCYAKKPSISYSKLDRKHPYGTCVWIDPKSITAVGAEQLGDIVYVAQRVFLPRWWHFWRPRLNRVIFFRSSN